MSHAPDAQRYHRACVECRGESWLTGPQIKGYLTITPCPECRPVVASRAAAGDYRPDAPHRSATAEEQSRMDGTPRTALFPWPQMLTAHPPPGPRPDAS